MNKIQPMFWWNKPTANCSLMYSPVKSKTKILKMLNKNIPIKPIGKSINALVLFSFLWSRKKIRKNKVVNNSIESIPEHGAPIITLKFSIVSIGPL
ncbi:MAG: hypothetical protein ABIB47_00555 [Candidatus Woesearchaeota archaeon]